MQSIDPQNTYVVRPWNVAANNSALSDSPQDLLQSFQRRPTIPNRVSLISWVVEDILASSKGLRRFEGCCRERLKQLGSFLPQGFSSSLSSDCPFLSANDKERLQKVAKPAFSIQSVHDLYNNDDDDKIWLQVGGGGFPAGLWGKLQNLK